MGAARGIAASASMTSFVLRMKAVTGGPHDTGKSCQVPFCKVVSLES